MNRMFKMRTLTWVSLLIGTVICSPARSEMIAIDTSAFEQAVRSLIEISIAQVDGDDEFYDLSVDPYELVNIVADPLYAEHRDLMRDALAQMIVDMPSDRQAESVSSEDIERLRALGYIQ